MTTPHNTINDDHSPDSANLSDSDPNSASEYNDDFCDILEQRLPHDIPLLLDSLGIRHERVTYLGTGMTHVVFGFDDVSTTSSGLQCAIRVQAWPASHRTRRELTSQAAILEHLGRHLTCAPRFIRMQYSDDNPLRRAYMITTRIRGICVNDICQYLSFAEELQLGKAVADEILAFQKVTFNAIGSLVAEQVEGAKPQLSVARFRQWEGLTPAPENTSGSIQGWLMSLLDWRIKDEASREGGDCERLKEMVAEMHRLGYFQGTGSVHSTTLSHPDLHYGNIMADRDAATGRWAITGIIDWDEALAMPHVMANRSLEWIWSGPLYADQELAMQWTGDLDFVPAAKMASLPDGRRELKARLDEYMAGLDSTYMDHAYGRGRWIRRVAKFAIGGWQDNRDDKTSGWILKEWARVRGHSIQGRDR